MDPLQILVPRWIDEHNLNPQNLNATSMLSRFRRTEAHWSAFYYESPAMQPGDQVELIRLWRTRLWKADLVRQMQRPADAIFYPGPEKEEITALRFRARSGRRVPVIATLEALAGDAGREAQLSEIAGHPVHCARVSPALLERIDWLYKEADLVIAISPFLAKIGAELYGPKFRVQMLGVDSSFEPPTQQQKNARPLVICVASFQERKRPELFVELARRFPDADFRWYGTGERLEEFHTLARSEGLVHLSFPGSVAREALPSILQSADLFVLPSNSEGVPKVTQEAAACGLPVVLFGHYESPSVIDRENGFVVWSDDEFFAAVEQLLSDEQLRMTFAARGAERAREWNWDLVAPHWENEILSFLGR